MGTISFRERVKRVQGSVGIQFEDFSPADEEHVNVAQMMELVLQNLQNTIHDLSVAL